VEEDIKHNFKQLSLDEIHKHT